MPVDTDGNITTTPSVVVKTIFDVMRDDKGNGEGVVITNQNTTP